MMKPFAPAAFVSLFLCLGAANKDATEQLWHHRNLGKAFFENPTTQKEAIDEFKEALDLAPNSTREQLNYGLALLHGGRTEEAVVLLQTVQQADPRLPHTWFNLGVYYRRNGAADKAILQFEAMTSLVPDEPKSHYNLGILYKQAESPGRCRHLYQREVEVAALAGVPVVRRAGARVPGGGAW